MSYFIILPYLCVTIMCKICVDQCRLVVLPLGEAWLKAVEYAIFKHIMMISSSSVPYFVYRLSYTSDQSLGNYYFRYAICMGYCFCFIPILWMFLSINIVFEHRIKRITMDLLHIRLAKPRIICRSISDLTPDSPYGVWCCAITTFVLWGGLL